MSVDWGKGGSGESMQHVVENIQRYKNNMLLIHLFSHYTNRGISQLLKGSDDG